ncbi:phosphoadenylyl-sulfate reductase [Klebsiella pneumoniae]|uniref:Phosphoadenylyl-sulfate reductase n=1 Tax=Klebsiella pneumoniae TaxID=573 RepID=A0A2X3CEQ1_KLEPN|nr:phosphoadenylyl-sulfate reductase [Klebsiella pneumoniae]
MSVLDLNALNALPKVERILALAETNAQLEKLDAEGRVAWRWKICRKLCAVVELWHSGGGKFASGESDPPGHSGDPHRYRLPVPETYQFIDELTDKLKLNLKVYRAAESAAWQEARYGKLWEQGVEGIEKYNEINKVEPMNGR